MIAVILVSGFSEGSFAQSGLPPQAVGAIYNAAASGGGTVFPLSSTVNTAIIYYPAHVEQIIATAIAAAPQLRDQIVQSAIWAFPGFQDRIISAAKGVSGLKAPLAIPVATPIPPPLPSSASPQATTIKTVASSPPQRPAPQPQTASTRPPPSLSQSYELGLRTVITTGETDWNHDASAGGVYGDPTSQLIYQDADMLALEFHGRAAITREYFLRGNVGFSVMALGDGNLRDNDWYAGQVLFSSTDSVMPDSSLFYVTADVGREMIAFGEGRGSLALFMGFQYWYEEYEGFGAYNLLTGAQSISTAVPVIRNKVEWRSFRLGAQGNYQLGDRLRWTADLALIPYTDMHNEDSHLLRSDLGAVPNIVMDGSGWGFQGETGLAYNLTQNWTATLDFRYWSMMSDGTITFAPNTSTPSTLPLNDLDTFRYGGSAGIIYGF